MPPPLIAAGIGAGASLIGGAIQSGSAKKAANAQAQSTRDQIAAAERNRDFLYGIGQPTIDRGNNAAQVYANFYGLNGGDAAKQALETFRGSTGYQDLLNQGLSAVNANAYARGQGQSGATYKALQDRGASIANQSAGQFTGGLSNLMNLGQNAFGTVAGVGTNTTNMINQASQAGADAQGNAALVSGNAWQRALQGITGAASYGLGSSYSPNGNSGYAPYNGPAGTYNPWQTY